ncbi:ImmA/IrrE family metallo-endopeptidase [Sporosarcina sp. FSL W7-1283]|uniref:ImmA/IrrE family metallo-endopeptidase n=1 Tax=Sporosarcina sp. FSL W7-1283 TaxID=2921560 RepID=UPI0030F4E42B
MPKQTAAKLMAKYQTNNPFEIAEQRGITVLYESLGSALGFYNSYKRIQFIHINNAIEERLQTFVCAHELGHAILHPKASTSFMKRNTFFAVEQVEVEANRFAVELLMPDESLYEHTSRTMTVQELASVYGVPEEIVHLKKIDPHGLNERVNFYR